MTCPIPVTQGSAVLYGGSLDPLPIDGTNGYSLESLQVGFPGERPVVRSRALSDGAFDESKYLGQRAVTMTVRLATRTQTQALIDQLLPFMSPRIRPTLAYALAGDNPFPVRSLTLRGVDAPVVIDGPFYQAVTCSWVSSDPFIYGEGERCTFLTVTAEEEGRVYDLTFDRIYGGGGSVASVVITNNGTAPAQWRASLSATTTNPSLRINGVLVTTAANGGVVLAGSDTLEIDTRERTCLLNGDPTLSRYNRLNYADWTWDDLVLQPGDNLIEYILDPGDESTMTFCWYDTWL